MEKVIHNITSLQGFAKRGRKSSFFLSHAVLMDVVFLNFVLSLAENSTKFKGFKGKEIAVCPC